MMSYWYNGKISHEAPLIPVTSRIAKFGDGFFETIRIWDSKPLFIEFHLTRFFRSCEILKIEPPKREYLLGEIDRLINHFSHPSARLRVTCFRDGDGLYLPQQNRSEVIMEINQAPEELYQNDSYRTGILKSVKISEGPLSLIKSTSALHLIMGAIETEEQGWDAGILLNSEGRVADATSYNVFIVIGNEVFTPSVDEGALPGVLREVLLSKIISKAGLKSGFGKLSITKLLHADEVFLTNAIKGIVPVSRIGHQYFEKREKTTRLKDQLIRVVNV